MCSAVRYFLITSVLGLKVGETFALPRLSNARACDGGLGNRCNVRWSREAVLRLEIRGKARNEVVGWCQQAC